MNLLHAWSLLLNVANESSVGPPPSDFACLSKSSAFDSDACYLGSVGVTKSQLRRDALLSGDAPGVSFAEAGYNCEHPFYTLGFEEFDKLIEAQNIPNLTQCRISTYAAVVQAAALKMPCRATTPDEASFLVVPAYGAQECNWPANREYCFGQTNQFRKGDDCAETMFGAVAQLRTRYPSKRILLVQQYYANDQLTIERLMTNSSKDPALIFARVQAMSPVNYREGVDVSMPPAASARCARTPPAAFDEPLSKKKYLFSFKGQMRTCVRSVFRDWFHNGRDQIIEDSADHGHDFDDLLYHSKFSLIIRGDQEFSFRFDEAVCSGGVPVFVGQRWVPPFNEFIPFESYGVYMRYDQAYWLRDVLAAIPEADLERKRARARRVCKALFQTTATQVRALLLLRFNMTRPHALLNETPELAAALDVPPDHKPFFPQLAKERKLESLCPKF